MEKRNMHTWVLEALKTSPAVEVTDMKFFYSSSCTEEGKCYDGTCIMQTHIICHSESKALKEIFFQGQMFLSISNVEQRNVNRHELLYFWRVFSFSSLCIVGINPRTQKLTRTKEK